MGVSAEAIQRKIALRFPLSVEEAGEWLGCDREHIARLIVEGKLSAFNIGLGRKPRWRITPAAIEAFERGETPAAKDDKPRRGRRKQSTDRIEFYAEK
jgi:excisionase family DNA binding protein